MTSTEPPLGARGGSRDSAEGRRSTRRPPGARIRRTALFALCCVRVRVLVVSRQPRASQRSSSKGLPNQAALIRRTLGEQHVSATAEGVNISDDGPADVPPRESVVAGIPEAVDAPAGDPRGPLMAEPRPMGRTARRRARRCVLFVTVGILAVVLLASVVVIILEA